MAMVIIKFVKHYEQTIVRNMTCLTKKNTHTIDLYCAQVGYEGVKVLSQANYICIDDEIEPAISAPMFSNCPKFLHEISHSSVAKWWVVDGR